MTIPTIQSGLEPAGFPSPDNDSEVVVEEGAEDPQRPVTLAEIRALVSEQNKQAATLREELHQRDIKIARMEGELSAGGRKNAEVLPDTEKGWTVARAFARELATKQEEYRPHFATLEQRYAEWRENDQKVSHERELEDVRLEQKLAQEGFDPKAPVAGVVRKALRGGATMAEAMELILTPHKAGKVGKAKAAADKATAEDLARRTAIESGEDRTAARPRVAAPLTMDEAATAAVLAAHKSGVGRGSRTGSLARLLGYTPAPAGGNK